MDASTAHISVLAGLKAKQLVSNEKFGEKIIVLNQTIIVKTLFSTAARG